MVTDSYDTSSCTAVIQLDDMRAPVVEVRDEPFEIWPVNHKYISLTPEMFLEKVEDACGRPIDMDSVEIVRRLLAATPEPEVPKYVSKPAPAAAAPAQDASKANE